MAKKYFKFVSAVYLFLIRDDHILLLRRANTGYEDGKYSLPAGHIEGKERATRAMIREAEEEIGIEVDEQQLHMVHVMHRISPGTHPSGCDERIEFFFEATAWSGEPRNMEVNKCDDVRFFPINQLPHNIIPYIAAAIEAYKKKSLFSEFGWKR